MQPASGSSHVVRSELFESEVSLKSQRSYPLGCSMAVKPGNLDSEEIDKALRDIAKEVNFKEARSNLYSPVSEDQKHEGTKWILSNKSIVIFKPCNHRARIATYARGVIPCPFTHSSLDSKDHLKDITLKDVADAYLGALRKLQGRATQLEDKDRYYDLAEVFSTAQRYTFAYILNCGHSIGRDDMYRTLKLNVNTTPDCKITITGNKVHCHYCKKLTSSAEPNLPLQNITKRFLSFVQVADLAEYLKNLDNSYSNSDSKDKEKTLAAVCHFPAQTPVPKMGLPYNIPAASGLNPELIRIPIPRVPQSGYNFLREEVDDEFEGDLFYRPFPMAF